MFEKQAPQCRYCSCSMIFDNHYGDCSYYCPDCKSASPVALTEEEAYEKAMRPLTQEVEHAAD